MRAAVLWKTGDETVEVRDDVEALPTGPGQVRVAIHATGVCHSDLSAMNGTIPQPAPVVLGHEGVGEVTEIGDGVDNVAVGDHVVVVWVPPCGKCKFCLSGQPNLCNQSLMLGAGARFKLDDQLIPGFAGTGTFADEVTLPKQAVVSIAKDVPWDVASLIGCGVTTGVGAAINAAKVRPGSSVVVFGCGGVGIATIQGARIAGAAEIVAVDLVESKREMAKNFGATHATSPEGLSAVRQEITGGDGFDYAFEVIGLPLTIRAAFDAVRRGGTAVVVGVGRLEEMVQFSSFELFYSEKKLIGTIYGSSDVRTDFDRMLRLWRTGRLDLEGMITQKLHLKDVNQALEDLKAGKVIRTVLETG